MKVTHWAVLGAALLLTACGGGGGSGSSGTGSGNHNGGGSNSAPNISVSSDALNFSAEAAGSTSPAQTITVTNTGNALLSVSSITLAGANASAFAETSGCSTVQAHGTCVISVTFKPTSTGSLGSSLVIASNAAISPTTITLIGTGAPASSMSLNVTPFMTAPGQAVTLTWSSTDSTSCSGSGDWSGSQTLNGTASLTAPATPGYYTYTLACIGTDGAMNTKSAVLTVYGALTPISSVTSVGYTQWYEPTLYVPPPNHIIALTTDTVVAPVQNTSTGTGQYWNYWPGLDPAPPNYGTINNGVLQAVLNFYSPYLSWYAISVYDNDLNPEGTAHIPIIEGIQTSFYDQIDGDDSFDGYHSFAPNAGDVMAMSIAYDSVTQNWTVTNTDKTLNESNTLIVNLSGQAQNYAYFALETHDKMPVSYSPVFTNTVITFVQPDTTGICSETLGQANNYTMTVPQLDSTGTKCTIAQIIIPHP